MNIIFVVLSYLFGSISSAIIICRLLGLPDPRSNGSQNPGATNVLRLAGKKYAILTLLGDMLKGLLPVVLVIWYGAPDWAIATTMLAAFVGHLYPVFFNFKGGKGVATAFGVTLGFHYLLGLGALLVWLLTAWLLRFSSLAALVSFSLVPLVYYLFFGANVVLGAFILITIFIFIRHRANIKRLLAGEESKIG